MMTPAEQQSEFQPSAAIATRGEIDIRALRKSLRLTRAKFCAKFKIRLKALRAYEAGKRRPDAVTHALLAIAAWDPSLAADAVKELYQMPGMSCRFYLADRFARNVMPIIVEIQRSGIVTPHRIAKELSRRGIATARGGQWGSDQVKRIIARMRDIELAEAAE